MDLKFLSLPLGLWAAGDEAQPQVEQLCQDQFPEGQEAVKQSKTHQQPLISKSALG